MDKSKNKKQTSIRVTEKTFDFFKECGVGNGGGEPALFRDGLEIIAAALMSRQKLPELSKNEALFCLECLNGSISTTAESIDHSITDLFFEGEYTNSLGLGIDWLKRFRDFSEDQKDAIINASRAYWSVHTALDECDISVFFIIA